MKIKWRDEIRLHYRQYGQDGTTPHNVSVPRETQTVKKVKNAEWQKIERTTCDEKYMTY